MRQRFGTPGLRAKDADRNRAVDLIDAAFSDGQLTAADREVRSERAIGAATLGELEALTRDLQDVPGVPVPGPARSGRGVLVGTMIAGMVILLGGGVTAVMLGPDDDPAPAEPVAQAPAEEPVVPIPEPEPEPAARPDPETEPGTAPEQPGYELTRQGVERFIAAHEEEFGPPTALAFGFARNQVVIYRSTEEDGKVRRWFYREGRFLDDGPRTPTGAIGDVEVDLREVSLQRLFANLRETRRASGLRKPSSFGATILHEDGRDVIFLVAADGKETCWAMHTDLDGTVLERGLDCYR